MALGMKETKSNIGRSSFFFRVFRAAAEAYLVGDEKFASDDEEKDDTGEDIGKGMVKTEGRGDLSSAAVEENEQEACEDHKYGVELCKPRYHDRREAAAARDRRGYGVVGAADEKKTRDAAYRARRAASSVR